MSCCVPNCPFRDKYLKQSSFCVPQDLNARSTWVRVLGINFDNNSLVCRQHFRDSDIIDTLVSGEGDDKYTAYSQKPMLRDEAIPIRVGELDLYNGGSIVLNDNTKISNNIGTSGGDVHHDLLSSINSDHCYTTIQIQEHNVNHSFGASTMNGLKRDAALSNVDSTSSISKRIKPSETWW